MWAVMMAAMMIPSASPLILLFAAINRERRKEQDPFVSTGMFLAGYLAAWTVFSALATLVQWGFQTATLLSHMLVINNPVFGGTLLFAAGVFQWSPLKYACLTRCRSPLGFLMNEWREGTWGALIMGLRHGIYCIGCCWLLMSLLFVTGVMNLLWMAIITVFVLLEKIVPAGYWVSRIAGLLLVAWGIWLTGGAFF
jgi:predicted metal-binding membrane protein